LMTFVQNISYILLLSCFVSLVSCKGGTSVGKGNAIRGIIEVGFWIYNEPFEFLYYWCLVGLIIVLGFSIYFFCKKGCGEEGTWSSLFCFLCWYPCFCLPFCVPFSCYFLCCKTTSCVFCGRSSASLNCCGHNNEKCYQENSRVIDSYPDSSLYFHADCGYSLKVWPKHKLPKYYCKKCKKNIDNDGGNAHICFRCEGIEQLRLCEKHNFGREPLKVDFQNLKIIPSVDNIVDV